MPPLGLSRLTHCYGLGRWGNQRPAAANTQQGAKALQFPNWRHEVEMQDSAQTALTHALSAASVAAEAGDQLPEPSSLSQYFTGSGKQPLPLTQWQTGQEMPSQECTKECRSHAPFSSFLAGEFFQ